jgi:hypothetical protein
MPADTNPNAGSESENTLSFEDAVKLMADEDSPDDEVSNPPKSDNEDESEEAPDDEGQEPSEDAEEPSEDEAPEEGAESEIKDDVLVKMEDGTTKPIAELKALAAQVPELEKKMTQSLQDVSSERRELKTLSENISTSVKAVIEDVFSMIPKPTDADFEQDFQRASLMERNYNLIVTRLSKHFEVAEAVEIVAPQISEADFKAAKTQSDAELVKLMPSLADPKRFSAVDKRIVDYAVAQGFSKEIAEKTLDPKLRLMVYKAARYDEDQAKAVQAKVKVQGAPPKAPPQKSQVHQNSAKALNQVNAIKRLKSTGSFEDAMKAYSG